VAALARQGLRPAEIAAQAGVGPERVRQILRLLGLAPARLRRAAHAIGM
jgi:hypothetical protein